MTKQNEISNYIDSHYSHLPEDIRTSLGYMMDAFYNGGYLPNAVLSEATDKYLIAAGLEHLQAGIPREAIDLLLGAPFMVSSRSFHSRRDWFDDAPDEMNEIRDLFLDVLFLDAWPSAPFKLEDDVEKVSQSNQSEREFNLSTFIHTYMNRDINYPHDPKVLKELIKTIESDLEEQLRYFSMADEEKYVMRKRLSEDYFSLVNEVITDIESGKLSRSGMFHFII